MFLLLTLVLSLSSTPEIKKEYFCAGVVPTGPYETLLDVEKQGDTYLFTWKTNEIKAKGLGVRKDNDIAVLFMDPKGQLGVVLYKITSVALEGVWTGGNGQVFIETCTLGKPSKA